MTTALPSQGTSSGFALKRCLAFCEAGLRRDFGGVNERLILSDLLSCLFFIPLTRFIVANNNFHFNSESIPRFMNPTSASSILRVMWSSSLNQGRLPQNSRRCHLRVARTLIARASMGIWRLGSTH